MLIVTGMLVGGLLLLVAALVLITQAGATRDDDVVERPTTTEVIYAAETDDALAERRQALADTMPDQARELLAQLRRPNRPADAPAFEAADWVAPAEGCLSFDEQVLISRSRVEPEFVDDIQCVLDRGRWTDRVHGQVVSSALDAQVVSFVPESQVWGSGGWNWTAETRLAFATDLTHPATHQVVANGFGHNPRQQGPVDWKPASRSSWCAYAVDWIAVKHRWDLTVGDDERAELGIMLDSCAEPESSGADPHTVTLDAVPRQPVSLLNS